ncbi:MAG: DNA cytosine methyltransferase [Pirellula sp.]
MKITQPIYKTVSLFSGGLGLDVGMKLVQRFDLLLCVEKVPAFCETIRANKASGKLPATLKVIEADIKTLDPAKIRDELGLKPGDLDVLVGGPPCQSFSTAGKRGTVQDPRGTLRWDYLRCVEAFHMDCFEVNSVNYGAPQIRERAIFVGNRYNAVVDFPNPTHGHSREEDGTFDGMLFGQSQLKPWRTLRDAIGDLHEPEPVVLDFSPRKKSFLNMVPPGSNWRSLPEEIQRESMGAAWHAKGGRSGWWRRLTMDLPCPTLVTMPNHASTSLCHPTETRALSLREYARIQEFPDDWKFCGTTAEKYAQVGNAVPVCLAKVSGEIIAKHLDILRDRDWQPFVKPVEPLRKVYVQSHVRTRNWFKDGETCVWKDDGDTPAYSAPKTIRKVSTLT